MLALLKQNPCKDPATPHNGKAFSDSDYLFRGTLVICPPNLIDQWRDEIRKCYGSSDRVLLMTTDAAACRVTYEQLDETDIILMSFDFILNQPYEKGNVCLVNLFKIKHYRIVIDEIHELVYQINRGTSGRSRILSTVITTLSVQYRWGMSATLKYDLQDLSRTGELIGIKFPPTVPYCQQFIDACVRRNTPDLNLPPLLHERFFITLSQMERAIYQTAALEDTTTALMHCNHFSLNDAARNLQHSRNAKLKQNDIRSNHLVTIDEVAKTLKGTRKTDVTNTKQALQDTTETLVELRNSAANMEEEKVVAEVQLDSVSQEEDPGEYDIAQEALRDITTRLSKVRQEIRSAETRIQSYKRTITRLESEILFFENTIKTLKKPKTETCSICLEKYGSANAVVALLRCGHFNCFECYQELKRTKQTTCPICRTAIDYRTVSLLKINNEEASRAITDIQPASGTQTSFISSNPDLQQSLRSLLPKYDLYGSKIADLAAYVYSHLTSDATKRIIIFCQFERLATLVSYALTEMGIANVDASGSSVRRVKAIRAFKSNAIPVIILNAECNIFYCVL